MLLADCLMFLPLLIEFLALLRENGDASAFRFGALQAGGDRGFGGGVLALKLVECRLPFQQTALDILQPLR